MTAAVRGTPSRVIAPTQNTAPVHEFRCLYTHDLRKKRKIWHDGSLRFHTFNRRVMVYDDSKNYLGDLHYREAEDLQEGEELRLDKGILVEVGDRIGTTETDLAPLLERRRPDEQTTTTEAPQPSRPHGASRILPAYAPGRPKSLAAVLGTSQGRTGRSSTSLRSPYEQRLDAANATLQEPRQKRQRLISGKENELQDEDSSTITPQRLEVQRLAMGPKVPTKTPARDREMPAAPKNVVEISSEDEDVSSPFLSSRPTPGPLAARKKQRKKPAKLPPVCSPPTAQPKQRPGNLDVERAEVGPMKAAEKSAASSTTGSTRLRLTSGSTTSSLRFARENPRMKLMYKELLPSSTTSSGPRRRSLENINQAPGDGDGVDIVDNITSAGQFNATVDGLFHAEETSDELFNADETIDFGSLPRQIQGHRSTPSKPGQAHLDLEDHHSSQRSSPLFVTQSPSHMPVKETLGLSPGGFMVVSLTQNSGIEAGMVARPADEVAAEDSIHIADFNTANAPPPSTVTMLDQTLLQPLAKFQQRPVQSPDKPRSPIRRVFSQGDSPVLTKTNPALPPKSSPLALPTKTMPPPQQIKYIPSALAGLQSRNRPPATKVPFKPPANLQRSASDTTGLVSDPKQVLQGVNIQPVPSEPVDIDMGPWSSKEAYLLFDFWPPDREDKRPRFDVVGDGGGGSGEETRLSMLCDEDGI